MDLCRVSVSFIVKCNWTNCSERLGSRDSVAEEGERLCRRSKEERRKKKKKKKKKMQDAAAKERSAGCPEKVSWWQALGTKVSRY